MKTLIELYDERPIENVLATEVFRPERTVFLCPEKTARDGRTPQTLRRYFRHHGLTGELVFVETVPYRSDLIAQQLRSVIGRYPDCVVDITGGTDAALFACGTVCAELGVPAFTYSRRRNCFFAIHQAPFPSPLPCTVRHRVEDCFLMAGGALRPGRVDNAVLGQYEDRFEPFFGVYLRHRAEWPRAVAYLQRVSQAHGGLTVQAAYSVRGERGSRLMAPESLLRELAEIGFLRNVTVRPEGVRFTFADAQIRAWLRDAGSVLELYVYRQCRASGFFDDVRTSVVVDWKGGLEREPVMNEIDVMAVRGILPVFISCKTCVVTTEALNELAVLRDRFGGKGARAVMVTSQRCRSVTRRRAAELEIDVADAEDLKSGGLTECLRTWITTDPGSK